MVLNLLLRYNTTWIYWVVCNIKEIITVFNHTTTYFFPTSLLFSFIFISKVSIPTRLKTIFASFRCYVGWLDSHSDKTVFFKQLLKYLVKAWEHQKGRLRKWKCYLRNFREKSLFWENTTYSGVFRTQSNI